MSIQRLSVGNYSTYLTQYTASAETLGRPGQPLGDYHPGTGNPSGRWSGHGAEDLGVTGTVSQAQLRALFVRGMHPDAPTVIGTALAAGESSATAESAARLGRRLPKYRPGQGREAVSGYDLVFSPVKSVSLLWALGDAHTRAEVEAAHHDAVGSTLDWLEQNAAFTRAGRSPVVRVETTGLICAMFDHHDSRAGDPDLHTHVFVANKVRARPGLAGGRPRWLALDGRALFHVKVAASERYNTRLEDALARRLGVEFRPRRDGIAGKRVVREIDGMPETLIRGFSKRAQAIEVRLEDLTRDYRQRQGRSPETAAAFKLAQQASLDTRSGKAPPRNLAERLTDWRDQAVDMTSRQTVDGLVSVATGRSVDPLGQIDWEAACAAVLDGLDAKRATWNRWHLVAEIERQTRPMRPGTPAERDQLVITLTEHVLASPKTVLLTQTITSRGAASQRYATRRILDAEQRLLAASASAAPPAQAAGLPSAAQAERLLTWHVAGGNSLDPGQRRLAVAFTTDPRLIVAGIGPAGSGKTSAMVAACAVWDHHGIRVIPLATSAASAQVLAQELGRPAENLHKYLYELDSPRVAESDFYRLQAGDVVLVDEAGMAGTLQLDRLRAHCAAVGARIRLLGDPAQLGAVEAGGALRLIAHHCDSVTLQHLHRFADPLEAAATLRVRDGDPRGLDFYLERDRVRTGDASHMLDAIYQAWHGDVTAGRDALMIVRTNEQAALLSRRAHRDRQTTGHVTGDAVELADGTFAGAGDWITTRSNRRTLITHGGKDFVKNGDTWVAVEVRGDGSMVARRRGLGGTATLPADYVRHHVQLGYASTIHRAQGSTVETAHAFVDGLFTREQLYVSLSRARNRTTLYVPVPPPPHGALDTGGVIPPLRRLFSTAFDSVEETGTGSRARTAPFARQSAALL